MKSTGNLQDDNDKQDLRERNSKLKATNAALRKREKMLVKVIQHRKMEERTANAALREKHQTQLQGMNSVNEKLLDRAKRAEATIKAVGNEVEWCDKYCSGDAARMVNENIQAILKEGE